MQQHAIDWSGIRAAAVSIGVRAAARQAAIGLEPAEVKRFEDRVRQRATREKWCAPVAIMSPRLTREGIRSPLVANGAQIMANSLASDERDTRAGLAKFAKKAIGAMNKSVHPVKYTKEAHEVARTAAIVHRWDAKEQSAGNVVVNIALLGVDPASVSASQSSEVLDVSPSE